MITLTREEAQQVLDALESCYDVIDWPADGETPQDDAAKVLRAKLSAPEQKDDGYCQACEGNNCTAKTGCVALSNPSQRDKPEPTGFIRTLVKVHADGTETWRDEPFYTAPPPQPEQIISQEWQPANPDAKLRHYSLVLRDLDKTIEGWCEQPEFYLDGKRIDVTQQKPVAWRKKWEGDEDYTYYWMCRYKDSEPLYTAPPQREFIGLTDMEIVGIASLNQSNDFSFARAIEAKLREKNT